MTVTRRPALRRLPTADRPAKPAPTITTCAESVIPPTLSACLPPADRPPGPGNPANRPALIMPAAFGVPPGGGHRGGCRLTRLPVAPGLAARRRGPVMAGLGDLGG